MADDDDVRPAGLRPLSQEAPLVKPGTWPHGQS